MGSYEWIQEIVNKEAFVEEHEIECNFLNKESILECDVLNLNNVDNEKVQVTSAFGNEDKIEKFSYTKVMTVKITKSPSTHLPIGIGDVFKNINALVVSESSLKFLHRKVFHSLKNLNNLRLLAVQIEELPEKCFDDLINLKVLNIQAPIKAFHDDLLSKLKYLEYFELTHSSIDKIDTKLFKGNKKLKQIILSDNQIKTVNGIFHGFKNGYKSLDWIDLSNNKCINMIFMSEFDDGWLTTKNIEVFNKKIQENCQENVLKF